MSTRRILRYLLAASAVFLLIFAIIAGIPSACADDATPATGLSPVAMVADAAPVATATAATLDPVAAVAQGAASGLASGVSGAAAPGALPPEVALIGVLATLAVASLKKFAPDIPGPWLPWISTAFGLLIELGLSKAGITHGIGWLGGLAGGVAGVGIREHVDQLKKASGFPALTASLLLAFGLLGTALIGSGCAVGRTIISRDTTTQSVTTNGIVLTSTVKEETRTTAKTLADAKFAQHAFRASQSAKSQNIGIGDQNAESTSDVVDKLANAATSFARLGAALQGVPVPAAVPTPAPALRAPPPEIIYVTNYVAVTASAPPRLSGTNTPAAK